MALESLAGEFVSFGLQKLWGLLSEERELFQGVEGQVTELKFDLNLLSSFVKDADAKKHTNAMVKSCVEEIKEIICDGEDIIETYILKQKLRKTSGGKKSIRRHACIIPGRRESALDIQGICLRISSVIQNMQRFGVQTNSDCGYMQPLRDRQREIRQTFPTDCDNDFVGLEANVKKLVGYFVEEENVQIVSITGMGGLGKTTLARQFFNHEDVKRKFDGLAWVCVSQDFSRMNVWQKILGDLKPKEEEKKILEMTENTLQDELFRLLETSKSLIVLDDIWEKKDWDSIKPIFPSEKDWKVLLTSRTEGIATRRNTTDINLKPECLTSEESWTLFQRIAFPRNDASEIKINEEMEEIGKEMVKHCGGLPLAIKVLGGMLVEKYTLHYWKRVSENIGSHLVGGRTDINDDKSSSFNYILSLSFEELPVSLKNCFLYLAHFPEDHKIDVEELSYYWAADGIFEPRHYDGETIRDVGDSYIEELVRRNMVISERDVTTLRSETCHLHDMMREICLTKAKEDSFLQIASNRASPSNFQSRRFVSHDTTTLHVERDISNPKLRSLVVMVKDSYRGRWKLSGSSFKRLELLRVLDLFKAEFEGGKLPCGIGKLIHLRYLSLKYAKVSHLPSSLGNLLLLIYLNLGFWGDPIFVPNVLMGMQELRYLALPKLMKRKTKLELRNLVKLETLKNFSTENSNLEDLRDMVKLKTLHGTFGKETSTETLSALIGGMRNLEDLNLSDLGSKRNQEEGIVLDFSRLTRLSLRMYMPNLLKQQHFPSHLTIISLEWCTFEDDPMPILEKLLQLKEVYLWNKSFSGRRMVCSGGGFPQLQKLDFYGLEEWEEWIVEEGSMPLLHTLYIWTCPKLKELPDGLRFIHSLKYLHLKDCHLEEDPMPILEKLLQLKEVNLVDKSFSGRRMVCSGGGFPQLQKLMLYELKEWEEWIVEEGYMPLLHTLYIWNCPKLKELPDGLRFITSLKELVIFTPHLEFKEKLSEGGEDFYKIQHIPHVLIESDSDWTSRLITTEASISTAGL